MPEMQQVTGLARLGVLKFLSLQEMHTIVCFQEYLSAKEKRMNHMLTGEWCFWNHDGEPGCPSSGKINDGMHWCLSSNLRNPSWFQKQGDHAAFSLPFFVQDCMEKESDEICGLC